MQAILLSSPPWQVALGALLVAMLTKGALAYCEALAKKSHLNGNKGEVLPRGLIRLAKQTPERDALRVTESFCGVVAGVITFLFLWNFGSLFTSLSEFDMSTKVLMAIFLVGMTALLQQAATVSLPLMLALKSSSKSWRKVFWIPPLTRWCIWPVRLLAQATESAMRRFLGVKTTRIDEDELQAGIDALSDGSDDGLSSGIREIVGNTLQLRNLDAQDILLPRHQVQVLDLNDPLAKNLSLAKSSGHTRFPLCDGDLDHCVGIVHVKDLFREMAEGKQVELEIIKRDFATFSPESPLIEVLQKMLQGRQHMALVREEFGGAIGVLTLEDALEEVVGEIKDEFDASEEECIQKQADGTFVVSGLAPMHEVEEALDFQCGNDEVSSFGGWITMALGRIPLPQEKLLLENLEVLIEKADGVRVIEASVSLIESGKKEAEEA